MFAAGADGKATDTIGAGTYAARDSTASSGKAEKSAIISFTALDATGKALVGGNDSIARGGSITLATVTDQAVTGTFVAEFPGGSLSGEFSARRCPSLEKRLTEQSANAAASAG